MRKKGVENTVLDWFQDYLENRTCETSLGGSTKIAKLNRGAPQGGCSLPSLGWNCPYDDLLYAYDNTGTEPFGFADDTKLLTPGSDFDTCYANAQHALRIAEHWARSIGVKFSPEKNRSTLLLQGKLQT